MKNTTFRKKALLSSVAMLLVALVALGSATFAWFSSNKEVTANQMNVKAAAAQGLVISIDNGADWQNSKTYTSTPSTSPAVLSPVSIGKTGDALNEKGFFPGEVKTLGGAVLDNDTTNGNANQFAKWGEIGVPTPDATSGKEQFIDNDYFAVFGVSVKSTSEKIENVKGSIIYTAGSPDAVTYIRMAVLDSSDKVLAVYGNETGATPVITAIDGDKATTGSLTTTAFSAGEVLTFKSDITAPAHNPEDTTAGEDFKVVIWFEGQDEQCKDNLQQAIGNLQFKFNY